MNDEINIALFDEETGWYAVTDFGVVWELFNDGKQFNPDFENEANKVVDLILETGKPPLGDWV
jgi:hypothetical protein